jgi:glutamate synthase domain-containing protein 3
MPDSRTWQLLGATDTSMLRPQVFALYENGPDVQIGLIASERQAINACLRSLSQEDGRFQPLADTYWVARGGSYTDGGAFVFTVSGGEDGCRLTCRDKFGKLVSAPQPGPAASASAVAGSAHALRDSLLRHSPPASPNPNGEAGTGLFSNAITRSAENWFAEAKAILRATGPCEFGDWLAWLDGFAGQDGAARAIVLAALTLLRDRRYDAGSIKRSALLAAVDGALVRILRAVPGLDAVSPSSYRRVDAESRRALRAPEPGEGVLVVDACGFPPEGEESAARLLCEAHALGWRRFVTFDWRGGRFAGCGLGPGAGDVRLHVYGDSGDYLGSGLDGAHVTVHGSAQDQVGQILKSGRLVIHGDVGQTFLYGAKGGEIYVLGSAAGRPLINAVGRPRAVINGTCLDYLAESFMAGDPLNGGGFAILNGITFDAAGRLVELDTPYPGGNLFSLASGGAIYLRDPHGKVEDDQLNGGRFAPLSDADWRLIEPYLRENEAHFGIPVADLLRVDGEVRPPEAVYRKVEVQSLDVLH